MIHEITKWVEFLTQLLIFIVVLYNIKISRSASNKVDRMSVKVEDVHKATNGLTERLEQASKREGIELGKVIGIQQQKDEEESKL